GGGEVGLEALDGAGAGGGGVGDLVGNVGGEPADGGGTVGLPHALLHALDRREVLADADETHRLALAGAQRAEGDAEGHLAAVPPFEADLVTRGGAGGACPGGGHLRRVHPPPAERPPRLAQSG